MRPDPDLQARIERFEAQYAGNPDSLVFARLADLHRMAGDPDRALEILQEGLTRHPEYASGHLVRGRCLRALDDAGEAREAFERVLDLDEGNLVALRALSELALDRGDRVEARRRLREVLRVDPGNDSAREALARLSDEPPEGTDDAVDAIPADPPAAGGGGAHAETDEGTPWWRHLLPSGGDATPAEPESTGSPPEAGVGDREEAADEEAPEAADGEDAVGADGQEAGVAGEASSDADVPEEDPRPEDEDARSEEEAREEEDRAAEPSGSPAFGSADADELGARVRELGRDVGAGEPAGDPDEELATETLAGLYQAQGFHREAVEMYEELVERRPDDEQLRRRLRRAREALAETGEALAETGEATGEPEEAAPATEVEEGTPETTGAPETRSDAAGAEDGGPGPDRAGTARDQLRALLRGEARPEERHEEDPGVAG